MNENEHTNAIGAWITVRQAAEILNLTVHGVRWLINRNHLTAIKPGRDWLVSLASVEAYKEKQEKTHD